MSSRNDKSPSLVECPYCQSKFKDKADLSKHIDRIHTGSGLLEGDRRRWQLYFQPGQSSIYSLSFGIIYSGGPIIADTLSLRTSIPIFIVKQRRLKAGDKFDRSLEARKNEISIMVRKIERGRNWNETSWL